ncbi:MAG: Hpt domain-containing protein [Myxococcota bacterium]|jgi:HPt (histidine-containing phosphotransfer) domain-containing protein|nr:Hpt domain-containing protein [Myxococcota bacterium]
MISVQLHHLTHANMRDAADELGLETAQYQELVGVFLTRTSAGIRELEAALEGGDDAAAKRTIHEIKGTALNMRLTMVAEPSVAMESVIKTAHKEQYPQRLSALKAGFDLLASEARSLGIEG